MQYNHIKYNVEYNQMIIDRIQLDEFTMGAAFGAVDAQFHLLLLNLVRIVAILSPYLGLFTDLSIVIVVLVMLVLYKRVGESNNHIQGQRVYTKQGMTHAVKLCGIRCGHLRSNCGKRRSIVPNSHQANPSLSTEMLNPLQNKQKPQEDRIYITSDQLGSNEGDVTDKSFSPVLRCQGRAWGHTDHEYIQFRK